MNSLFFRFLILSFSISLFAETPYERVQQKFNSANVAATTSDFAKNSVWEGKCVETQKPQLLLDVNLGTIVYGDPILGYSLYFDLLTGHLSASQIYGYITEEVGTEFEQGAYHSTESNSLVLVKKGSDYKELRKAFTENGAVYFILKEVCLSNNCGWLGSQPYKAGDTIGYCYFYSKIE